MKKADTVRNNKSDLERQYSEEVTEQDLTQDSSEETLATDALYILKLEQERVVIYYAESGELYDETDITSSVLPEDLVRKLQQGIQVHSLKELYDFLENYSS